MPYHLAPFLALVLAGCVELHERKGTARLRVFVPTSDSNDVAAQSMPDQVILAWLGARLRWSGFTIAESSIVAPREFAFRIELNVTEDDTNLLPLLYEDHIEIRIGAPRLGGIIPSKDEREALWRWLVAEGNLQRLVQDPQYIAKYDMMANAQDNARSIKWIPVRKDVTSSEPMKEMVETGGGVRLLPVDYSLPFLLPEDVTYVSGVMAFEFDDEQLDESWRAYVGRRILFIRGGEVVALGDVQDQSRRIRIVLEPHTDEAMPAVLKCAASGLAVRAFGLYCK